MPPEPSGNGLTPKLAMPDGGPVIAEKSHSLPARHFDSYDEIAAWFERHGSMSPVSGR